MVSHGYLTEDGKPTETARAAVVEQTAPLPPQMETAKESIAMAIQKGTTVNVDDIVGKLIPKSLL